MPLLIVTCEETNLSQRFLVTGERFTIGRSRASEVSIRDRTISKLHIVIQKTPSGYTFQDLWSQNGTCLNGARLESGPLKRGDVLQLGRVRVAFHPDEAALPPALAWAQAPGRAPGLSSGDLGSRRGPRLRHRPLIVLGIGALGLVLGLLLGRLLSPPYLGPGPAGPPPPSSAGPVASSLPPASPEALEPQEATEGPAVSSPSGSREDDEEPGKIAATYLEDLRRPYADSEESRRVLFRLFLDILGRTPTRTERQEFLPLEHGERWQKIHALGSRPAPGDLDAAFQKFLNRPPTNAERRALAGSASTERKAAPGREDWPAALPEGSLLEAGLPEVGLLLTASAEYRSPRLVRPRSLDQRARSLIVDLLDRPPGEEEAREVEQALRDYPRGAAVARVLASSEEATRTLPVGNAKDDARAWVAEEIRRFLLREPRTDEIEAVMAELARGPEGVRWVRLALASAAGYRSY